MGHSFGGKGNLTVCSHKTWLLYMNRSETKILTSMSFTMYVLNILHHVYAVALSMVDQAAKPLARPVRVSLQILDYSYTLILFKLHIIIKYQLPSTYSFKYIKPYMSCIRFWAEWNFPYEFYSILSLFIFQVIGLRFCRFGF